MVLFLQRLHASSETKEIETQEVETLISLIKTVFIIVTTSKDTNPIILYAQRQCFK